MPTTPNPKQDTPDPKREPSAGGESNERPDEAREAEVEARPDDEESAAAEQRPPSDS